MGGPKTRDKDKEQGYDIAPPKLVSFSPTDAVTLDRFENGLLRIKNDITQNRTLEPQARQEMREWLDGWLYGRIGSGTPWDILKGNLSGSGRQTLDVRIDIPHSQQTGHLFFRYLQNIPGLKVESEPPAAFGQAVNYLSFHLVPSAGQTMLWANPFNRSITDTMYRANSPPQRWQDYLPKSRAQIEQEGQKAIQKLTARPQENVLVKKELTREEPIEFDGRSMAPLTTAESAMRAYRPTLTYDEQNDTYTHVFVDSQGRLQARNIPASDMTEGGKLGFDYSLNSMSESMARLLLPIESIESLVVKYRNDQPVGFWDWAWVVADVGLTVAEVKLAYKTVKIAANSKFFFDSQTRRAIDAGIEREFAGDAARAFAAKRYWRRKFLTEPTKFVARNVDEFVDKAGQIAAKGGMRYETGKAVMKASAAVTRASGWQMTKNIAITVQATFMTGATLYSIERGTELLLSPTLPDWVIKEHPNWKEQGLNNTEMRELAMKETRMDMAAIWGVFETIGLSSKAVRALAPKIRELLGHGVKISLEGKDPTGMLQEKLAPLLKEAGMADAPAVLEKPVVEPFVKIVNAMAKGAKKAGKWALTTTGGEMGVADTAFLSYWQLSSEKIAGAESSLIQDGVVRKATEHAYAQYLGIESLDEKGERIVDKKLAEKENRNNLQQKFIHLSPERAVNSQVRTAFLLDFVSNAMVIDMENPQVYSRVTQGTASEAAIPPERFNLFVLLERQLRIVPASEKEQFGDYGQLEKLLLRHYRPRELNALYSEYNGRALDLWLDVEAMAARWLAEPARMEQELPSAIRQTFADEWKRNVKEVDEREMQPEIAPNGPSAQDRQMMAAMGQILKYTLQGYVKPQKREI